MWRFTADQAEIAPYGNELCLFADRGFSEPIGILAAFAAAIDKCACKYVVIFQAGSPVSNSNARKHRRYEVTTMPVPRAAVLLFREQIANFGQ